MSKPVCVVWTNERKDFEQALTRAGLTERLELHCVKREEPLPDDLAERADILVAWKPGSYRPQDRSESYAEEILKKDGPPGTAASDIYQGGGHCMSEGGTRSRLGTKA